MTHRALVLGGNGFIGRNIAARLTQLGYHVSIGTRHPDEPVHHLLPPNTLKLGIHMEQMLSTSQWQAQIESFDIVINAIGILRQRGKENYQDVHHHGPKALAEACTHKNIPLIHISALGLRNPVRSGFLSSKLQGEDALLRSGARVCIVRPSLLDGDEGYGSHWVRFFSRWPMQFYPSNATGLIACCSVIELGEAIGVLANKLLEDTDVPCMLEIGGDQEETIAEHLARRHQALRGFRPLQIPVPRWLARISAHVFDLLHFSPFSFGHYELLRFDNCPRPNRLGEFLGRKPVDVVALIGGSQIAEQVPNKV